jgi:hypothetical protein
VCLCRHEIVQVFLFPRDITGAGGMAEVIEDLLSKHEALDSSHSRA